MNEDRPMPENVEAERAVLGSMLILSSCYDRVIPIIETADFRSDGHRAIFRALASISRHFTNVRSGFPFSTTYVASSLAVPLPTFFAAWIVPAGMKRTSPALSVIGGFPSI